MKKSEEWVQMLNHQVWEKLYEKNPKEAPGFGSGISM